MNKKNNTFFGLDWNEAIDKGRKRMEEQASNINKVTSETKTKGKNFHEIKIKLATSIEETRKKLEQITDSPITFHWENEGKKGIFTAAIGKFAEQNNKQEKDNQNQPDDFFKSNWNETIDNAKITMQRYANDEVEKELNKQEKKTSNYYEIKLILSPRSKLETEENYWKKPDSKTISIHEFKSKPQYPRQEKNLGIFPEKMSVSSSSTLKNNGDVFEKVENFQQVSQGSHQQQMSSNNRLVPYQKSENKGGDLSVRTTLLKDKVSPVRPNPIGYVPYTAGAVVLVSLVLAITYLLSRKKSN